MNKRDYPSTIEDAQNLRSNQSGTNGVNHLLAASIRERRILFVVLKKCIMQLPFPRSLDVEVCLTASTQSGVCP